MRRLRHAIAVAVVLAGYRAEAAPADAPACIAQSERGQLDRDEGRLLEAREAFVACSREDCPRVVRKDCQEFLADLERRVPTVLLVARDSDGRDLTRVRVKVDDKPFAEMLGATALPIDPGSHRFRFEWDQGPPVE